MTETTANIAVVLATASTIVFLIPQIRKLITTGDSAGVSTTWAALGLVSNIGWFVYMFSQARWIALAAPSFTTIFYAVTLWALARTGRSLNRGLAIGLGWAGALSLIAVQGGWTALGVVLGLTYAVMVAPSIWAAYRTPDPSGVSPATWSIGAIEGMLWGTYGLFHLDPGIITFGVVQILASLLILTRYYATRRPVSQPA